MFKIGAALVYYKLGQPLLQNRAAITDWGKIYYILGQVLQIRAIITNWGITPLLFVIIAIITLTCLVLLFHYH